MRLLLRSARRGVSRRPWQFVLSILGVAVAVAVVVGIDLANAGSQRAFELGVEGVAGRATHEIVGGPDGLAEELYVELRRGGLRASAPVVEGWLRTDARPGTPLRLLGVDPFAEARFRGFTRSFEESDDAGDDLRDFLIRPGAIAAAPETAAELGVEVGESFIARVSGRRRDLVLVSVLQPDSRLAEASSKDLLVADLATAQEVLDRVGRLSRIDLILEEGEVEAVRAMLPTSATLRPRAARSDTLEQMTRAFRLNLRALALLALIVGMFLIYNTTTFSVVQRREMLGTLRALGVTRREILLLVLGESAVVGAVGSLLGCVLGAQLARVLIELVLRTINDLYFVTSIRGVELSPWVLAEGVLLGLGGTLLATLPATREAVSTPPRAAQQRSHLERRAARNLPRLAAAGAALVAASALLAAIPSKSLLLGFGSIFLFLLGSAALVPPLATVIAEASARPLRAVFGVLGSLASRGISAAVSRTGVALAALVVAVAMTVGVGVMVTSFRATLTDWLDTTLAADVYVAPIDVAARDSGRRIDPRVLAAVRASPGVAEITTWRRVEAPSTDGSVPLTAMEIGPRGFARFSFAQGSADAARERFMSGDGVLLTEPYSFRNGLDVGDFVELPAAAGPQRVEVVGVVYDYVSDRGAVVIERGAYDRLWDDPGVQSLSVDLAEGVEIDAFMRDLRSRVGELQELSIAPNRSLRRGALEIFDRTFLITAVLRLLAIGVAAIGILSALMALQLERARELGVLRATGMTPRQVWGLATAQTGLMGLIAGLLSVPLGLGLATLLIRVINRRAFGWTLRLDPSPEILWQAVLLAVVASLAAGLYPAWKSARSSPAWALRSE